MAQIFLFCDEIQKRRPKKIHPDAQRRRVKHKPDLIGDWVQSELRKAEQRQDNFPAVIVSAPSPEASARMDKIAARMIEDILVVNRILVYTGPTIVEQD